MSKIGKPENYDCRITVTSFTVIGAFLNYYIYNVFVLIIEPKKNNSNLEMVSHLERKKN